MIEVVFYWPGRIYNPYKKKKKKPSLGSSSRSLYGRPCVDVRPRVRAHTERRKAKENRRRGITCGRRGGRRRRRAAAYPSHASRS